MKSDREKEQKQIRAQAEALVKRIERYQEEHGEDEFDEEVREYLEAKLGRGVE